MLAENEVKGSVAMPYVIGAIIAGFVIWVVLLQRRLIVMDENINSAMSQIGVQLSSCFDALIAVLDIMKDYAADEAQIINDGIKQRRRVITARSVPDDVLTQERLISEVREQISMAAGRYPELTVNKSYVKYMDAIDSYEKMMRTSSLIYNDSVTKLNRELRMFPTCLLGSIFGFKPRDYLDSVQEKPDHLCGE